MNKALDRLLIKYKDTMNNQMYFNIFLFISTFSKSLIEIFMSLYLFKNGFDIKYILLFYTLTNTFSIPLAYLFTIIGEKYKYSTVMYIGITFFIGLQIILNYPVNSLIYIILIALLYSMYRRGYWVSRRFYITSIVPKKESSKPFSLIMIISEIASILSGYIGATLLDNFNYIFLALTSSILLFISIIPLTKIKYNHSKSKIELIKKLKKYDKRNYIAFSMYELNDLLGFIFPIYIAIYIQDSYTMTGTLNIISNLSVILFIYVYGKIINKNKNYFILSTILMIIINLTKLVTLNYIILIIFFIDGIIKKMQNQSINKIYFENRNNMDLTHYNLIYQIVQSIIRASVSLPLIFMNNIRIMVIFVIIVINIELIVYINIKKTNSILK